MAEKEKDTTHGLIDTLHDTLQKALHSEEKLNDSRKAELKHYVDKLVTEQDASAIDGRLEDVSRQLAELSPILNDTYLVEKAAEYQLPLQKVEEVPFLRAYVTQKQLERVKSPLDNLLSLAEPLEQRLMEVYALMEEHKNLFKVVKSRSLSNIGLWYSEHTSLVLDTDYSTVIAYKSDQGTETATINHSVSFIVSSEKTPSKRMYVGFETNICSDGDRAGYWTELQQKKQKKGQKPGLAIRLLRGRYDAGRGYCNKNISVGFENYGCPKQYLKTIGHLLEGSPEACTESLSLAFKHIEFLLKSPKVLQQKIQQLQQLRLEQTAGLLDKLKQLGGKLHE